MISLDKTKANEACPIWKSNHMIRSGEIALPWFYLRRYPTQLDNVVVVPNEMENGGYALATQASIKPTSFLG